MKLELYINDTRVDMFDDETVTLKKSLKDAKSPDRLFTDLSRTISIPASKKNNKLFVHAYRTDTNAVDVRAYLEAEIKLNGITYSKGFVNLEKVKLKSRIAHSYNLRYTGKLVELKKKFKEDKLAVLDFSDLDYEWNSTNAKSKLTASGDIVGTLNSIKERYIVHESDIDYAVTNAGSTADSPIQNIAYIYSSTADGYGINFTSLRPSLKVSRIIDEIEDYYGVSFTGALKEDYVQDLYCLLHRQDSKGGGQGNNKPMDFNTSSDSYEPEADDIGVVRTQTLISSGNSITFPTEVKNNTYSVTVSGSNLIKIELVDTLGNVLSTQNASGNSANISATNDVISARGVRVMIYGLSGNTYTVSGTWRSTVADSSGNVVATLNISLSGSLIMTGSFFVNENIPDIKVVDFIGGLFKMFNMIATVEGTTVNTQTHEDFIASGTHYGDITQFIDSDSQTVSPASLYSSVKFAFSKPETRLEKAFHDFNLREYGSNEYVPTDVDDTRLAGEQFKAIVPFQSLVGEPLSNLGVEGSAPAYSYVHIVDKDGKEVKTAPFLHYVETNSTENIALNMSTSSVHSVGGYNEATPYNSAEGVFLSFSANDLDYRDNSVVSNGSNLFTNFYQTQIIDGFDSSARRLECSAHLPLKFHKDFELNQTINAYGEVYRVESIDTNFLTGVSKLTLISA
jgi:hypothetical protein